MGIEATLLHTYPNKYRLSHGFSCTSPHTYISQKPSYISPSERSERGPDKMRFEG